MKAIELIKILQNVKSIKARDLTKLLELKDERQLRELVSYTRQNLDPCIVSGNFGYKYEKDIEEVRGTLRRLRKHAISELQVIQKQEKLLKEQNYNVGGGFSCRH